MESWNRPKGLIFRARSRARGLPEADRKVREVYADRGKERNGAASGLVATFLVAAGFVTTAGGRTGRTTDLVGSARPELRRDQLRLHGCARDGTHGPGRPVSLRHVRLPSARGPDPPVRRPCDVPLAHRVRDQRPRCVDRQRDAGWVRAHRPPGSRPDESRRVSRLLPGPVGHQHAAGSQGLRGGRVTRGRPVRNDRDGLHLLFAVRLRGAGCRGPGRPDLASRRDGRARDARQPAHAEAARPLRERWSDGPVESACVRGPLER